MEVHGLRTIEAWLEEFWALLYQCVRWVQLCGSLSILWHCLSLELEWRWQEYTEELYKKDLHDRGNHNGVITHLEPESWNVKVKWASQSITTNKASRGGGIPVELFQILKDDAVKVLHSICQQIWKTQQWPQDGKRTVFIPIPKKGNAKECSNQVCHLGEWQS